MKKCLVIWSYNYVLIFTGMTPYNTVYWRVVKRHISPMSQKVFSNNVTMTSPYQHTSNSLTIRVKRSAASFSINESCILREIRFYSNVRPISSVDALIGLVITVYIWLECESAWLAIKSGPIRPIYSLPPPISLNPPCFVTF